MLSFPEDFLWGAATSSHQVEGGNTLNDWWAWEQTLPLSDSRSNQACNHWNTWKADVQLIHELGHTAHRLSIEWSRIEPESGVFDEGAIAHYRDVLRGLKARGIKTVVTLHHFTNPKWLAAQGGWLKSCVVKRYLRYVEKVVRELGSEMDFILTLNEPGVYAYMSYRAGLWPPQKKSSLKMLRVLWHMARAHRAAYELIKQLSPATPVGIAQNMSTFEPVHPTSWQERFAARWLHAFNNLSFYWLSDWKTHDVLGINYYFHRRLDATGRIWPGFQDPHETNRPVSDLGWELHPEGLGGILQSLIRYHKPLLVTEHGLADAADSRRPKYLTESLEGVSQAIQAGAPVVGYLHWSLLDNFEWADGFMPRFGLVEVEYATQKRTPRPSAFLYKKIIEQTKHTPHE